MVEVKGAECIRLVLVEALRIRKLRRQIMLWQKKSFDKSVAKIIKKTKPEIFVGFEISCAKSMKAAQEVGAVTVLDMAGLEHDFALRKRSALGPPLRAHEANLKRQKTLELARADHILCVSELARNSLLEAGIAPQKIHVIPLGLNQTIFSAKARIWDRADQPFCVVYAGNLSLAKGVFDLVQAFKKAAIPNSELHLIGTLSDIKETDLKGDNITIFPFMSAEALAAKFRESDVFVLPSYLDSWGQVIPEAMSCGLPVIATDMCGASDLITPETGHVIKAGQSDRLTEILRDMAKHREVLSVQGRNGVQAVSHLTWEIYAENICKFHASLTKGVEIEGHES